MSDDLIKRLAGHTWYTVDATGKRCADDAPKQAAAALAEAQAEIARLREALEPFAFYSDEPNTTQDAWEIRYRDRFKDWIDFADIESARAALEARHG
jgi:hypothetical protein